MAIEERTVVCLCLGTFGIGVFVGYKLKSTRMKYLQWRRERLINKLNETTKKINLETAG